MSEKKGKQNPCYPPRLHNPAFRPPRLRTPSCRPPRLPIPSCRPPRLSLSYSPQGYVFSSPRDETLYPAAGIHALNPGEGGTISFFPAMPQRHGATTYFADRRRTQRASDACRKYFTGHPTLTPGVFTVFCQHGICYGFEVMTTYESPKVPFNIFLTRFEQAPKVIVYDNACQLHRYCLNREPHWFKDSLFAVDRLHWDNHTACAEGYNLSFYNAKIDVANINSQVNEQANAGLS